MANVNPKRYTRPFQMRADEDFFALLDAIGKGVGLSNHSEIVRYLASEKAAAMKLKPQPAPSPEPQR